MQDTNHSYTHLEIDEEVPHGLYICDDCGATAWLQKEVEHYPNCKPGDAQRWADYYNQQEQEDE